MNLGSNVWIVMYQFLEKVWKKILLIKEWIRIWGKIFRNGPSKFCMPKADHIPSNFLKAVFHKLYLIHSWILCFIRCFDDQIAARITQNMRRMLRWKVPKVKEYDIYGFRVTILQKGEKGGGFRAIHYSASKANGFKTMTIVFPGKPCSHSKFLTNCFRQSKWFLQFN